MGRSSCQSPTATVRPVYQILPRGGYSYVTTKGCYTAKETFSVFEDMTVKAKRPREEDWLTGLQICAGSTKSSASIWTAPTFKPRGMSTPSSFPIPRVCSMSGLCLTRPILSRSRRPDTSVYTKTLTASGKVVRGLAAADGQEKTLTLSLSLTENGCTYVQNYTVQVSEACLCKVCPCVSMAGIRPPSLGGWQAPGK